VTLEELFRDYPRIVVTGGPITGKSIITDSAPASHKVFHSDDIVSIEDEDQRMREKARTLLKLVDGQDKYIVAGVAAHAALKYGLPADCIVLCEKFHGKPGKEIQLPGQRALSKGAANRSRQEAKARRIPLIPFRGRNDYRWDSLKVDG
jgi:hypothetical protein